MCVVSLQTFYTVLDIIPASSLCTYLASLTFAQLREANPWPPPPRHSLTQVFKTHFSLRGVSLFLIQHLSLFQLACRELHRCFVLAALAPRHAFCFCHQPLSWGADDEFRQEICYPAQENSRRKAAAAPLRSSLCNLIHRKVAWRLRVLLRCIQDVL